MMSKLLSEIRMLAGLFICVILLACTFTGVRARAEQTPVIAVASSLQFAIDELTSAFTDLTGRRVSVALGASGNFARQIRQGAPFEVFLAADEEITTALADDGFTDGAGAVYAEGRLALYVPHGSPLLPDPELDDLAAALDDGRLRRFAIANPDHAPYGARAREVLERRGIWDAIVPRLVMGEAVAQAAQFAASGNAEGGLIAGSLAGSPELVARGTFVLVPSDRHGPLRQRIVLLKDAGPVARAFYEFVLGPQARAILKTHGFGQPDAPS